MGDNSRSQEWMHTVPIAHLWPHNFIPPPWSQSHGLDPKSNDPLPFLPYYGICNDPRGYVPQHPMWHGINRERPLAKDKGNDAPSRKSKAEYISDPYEDRYDRYPDLNTPNSLLNLSNFSFSGMWPEVLNDSINPEENTKTTPNSKDSKTPKPYKGKRRGRKPKNRANICEDENIDDENNITKTAYSDSITELTLKVVKLMKVTRRDAPPKDWNTNFPFPRGSLPNKKSNYYKYVHSYNNLPAYSESVFDEFEDADEHEVYINPIAQIHEDGEENNEYGETQGECQPFDLSHDDKEKYKNTTSTIQRKALKRRKIKTRIHRRYPHSNRRKIKPSMTTTIRAKQGGTCPNKMQLYQKYVLGDRFVKRMREERMTEKLIKVLCSTPQRTLRNNCKKSGEQTEVDDNNSFASQETSELLICDVENDEEEVVPKGDPPEGYFFVEGGVCPDIEATIGQTLS